MWPGLPWRRRPYPRTLNKTTSREPKRIKKKCENVFWLIMSRTKCYSDFRVDIECNQVEVEVRYKIVREKVNCNFTNYFFS